VRNTRCLDKFGLDKFGLDKFGLDKFGPGGFAVILLAAVSFPSKTSR
jgi:hypothetical protein